jgi:hypothetical protein
MLRFYFRRSRKNWVLEEITLTTLPVCVVFTIYHCLQGLVNANNRQVYHDTTISHVSGPRTVCVKDVLVVFEQNTDPSKPSIIQQIKCDAMDVEFGDSSGEPSLLFCQLLSACH